MTNERKALFWIKVWSRLRPDPTLPKGWPLDSGDQPMSAAEIIEAGLIGQELPNPPKHLVDEYDEIAKQASRQQDPKP